MMCGIALRGRGGCEKPAVTHVDVKVSGPEDLRVFPDGFVRVYLCADHYDRGQQILELNNQGSSLPYGVTFHD